MSRCLIHFYLFFFFFFNDTATTEIYTLSLHDALPIYQSLTNVPSILSHFSSSNASVFDRRSEERFSRNAETDLVCRLLLEKKKKTIPLPAANTILFAVPMSITMSPAPKDNMFTITTMP